VLRAPYPFSLSFSFSLACALCIGTHIVVFYSPHSLNWYRRDFILDIFILLLLYARRYLYEADRRVILSNNTTLTTSYFRFYSFPSLSIVKSIKRIFRAILQFYRCPKMTKYVSREFKISGFRVANACECLEGLKKRRLRIGIGRRRNNFEVSDHLFIII